MLNREVIKVVISVERKREEAENQLKYLIFLRKKKIKKLNPSLDFFQKLISNLKVVKFVEDILTEEEEATKKPASEKTFSENIEFFSITELKIA